MISRSSRPGVGKNARPNPPRICIGLDNIAYSSAYVASWSNANSAIIHQLIETVRRRFDAITQVLASAPITASQQAESVA